MAKKSPLEMLADKLRHMQPPSILSLITALESAEEYREFVKIVREFTPDHEREILNGGTPSEQMGSFASYFEERYFPLDYSIADGSSEEYYELTRAVPIICLGLSYDDYDEIICNGVLGYQILAFIAEDEEEYQGSLAEQLTGTIPLEVLQQQPRMDSEEAYSVFQVEGRYPGIAWWVRVRRADTGNVFHDICAEDYAYQNVQTFEWIKGEIDELTLQWQRADVIVNEIHDAAGWLEQEPVGHFLEVVNFIKDRLAEREGNAV